MGPDDITILGRGPKKQVPKKLEIDPVAKQTWINDRIAEIKASLNSMKADDLCPLWIASRLGG
jgi:hypothetical protein